MTEDQFLDGTKRGQEPPFWLDEEEIDGFRQWARDNYEPLTPISTGWHPIIQDECRIMNEEKVRKLFF